MSILKFINKCFSERTPRSEMARYYRVEFARDWEQCRKSFPNASDEQIVSSCFTPRFD